MRKLKESIARLKSAPNAAKLAGLLASGLLLACGRFDWSSQQALAFRSWTFSAYFFCLLLVGLYAAGRAFSFAEHRRFWPALAGMTVLLNIPYRWLRLDLFFYLAHHPLDYGKEKLFTPEWLGRGHPSLSWNGTDAFFLIALLMTGLGGLLTQSFGPKSTALRPPRNRRIFGFFLLLFAFITTETWLHVSNRSPYTYISHYERPEAEHYVYAYHMLPDGRGAVNEDFAYFVRLEELFQGTSGGPPMLMIHRVFAFYVSSHLSYFIGPYYAFLVINLAFWLAAAASIYFFARDITGSAAVAVSAAGFVACGPGFIMVAAQPMAHLASLSLFAITIFVYHRLTVTTRMASWPAICAAGILLGFTLLTYDSYAWILLFIAYALLFRASIVGAVVSAALAGAIYMGYMALLFSVFKMTADNYNDRFASDAIRHCLDLLRHPVSAEIFPMMSGCFGEYCSQVMQASFYVPFILGTLGLFLLPSDARQRSIALVLLLPSVSSFAILYFGGAYQAGFSRLNYPSYPGIVLLAALAVGRSVDALRDRGRPMAAALLLGLPLAACATLANLDAFGFMPHLYYHFYFSTGGHF